MKDQVMSFANTRLPCVDTSKPSNSHINGGCDSNALEQAGQKHPFSHYTIIQKRVFLAQNQRSLSLLRDVAANDGLPLPQALNPIRFLRFYIHLPPSIRKEVASRFRAQRWVCVAEVFARRLREKMRSWVKYCGYLARCAGISVRRDTGSHGVFC